MAYYGGGYVVVPRPPRPGRFDRGDPGFLSFLGGIGKAVMGGLGIPTVPKTGAAGVAQIGGMLGTVLGRVRATAASPTVQKVLKAGAPAAAGVAAGAMMTASGGAMAHPGAMGGGGGGRRGRRMNVTNVKALRRSVRRCQGFAKLAKRVLRFTSPKPVRGRPVFKRRAKKRSV